jgi:hypothetical protein
MIDDLQGRWRGALALIVVALAAIGACGLSPDNSHVDSPLAASDGPVAPSPTPATPTPTASPTVEAAPTWIADLAGQLDCDGPMNQMGSEVAVAAEPMDPVATPEQALEVLLKPGVYAWLPARGFEPPVTDGPWALNRYVVGGRLKAIAVSTNRFQGLAQPVGWEVAGVRACDPSEFDPGDGLTDGSTLWTDADGAPARAERIFSRSGPGHCGWEGITFLEFEGKQYLRDPKGLLADQTARPFRVVAALPSDAVDTGLHTAKWRLFTVPDERVVYARRSGGTIERWGRTNDEIGCM